MQTLITTEQGMSIDSHVDLFSTRVLRLSH